MKPLTQLLLNKNNNVCFFVAEEKSITESDEQKSSQESTVGKVEVKLLVFNLPDTVDDELLHLYFESPRASGSHCSVSDVRAIGAAAVLISFDDPSGRHNAQRTFLCHIGCFFILDNLYKQIHCLLVFPCLSQKLC